MLGNKKTAAVFPAGGAAGRQWHFGATAHGIPARERERGREGGEGAARYMVARRCIVGVSTHILRVGISRRRRRRSRVFARRCTVGFMAVVRP